MPVDEPDNFVVAFRQLDGRNFGHALEAGKAGHIASMIAPQLMRKTWGLVYSGKWDSGNG